METAREIDVAIRDIVAQGLKRASEILNARRADLDEGAWLLLLQETLTVQEFPAIRPQGRLLERNLQVQFRSRMTSSLTFANSKGLPVPVERVQFSTKLNYAE